MGSPDLPGSIAFYSGLFGWAVIDQGPDAGGYCMAELDGKPVAGLGPAQQAGPPYWTTYISVEDANATADAVTAAGGQVLVPPFDVFDSGRMAVCIDTVGAVFSIWQAKEHIGARLVNEPGTLTWNELTTREPAKAKEFYGAVVGWVAQDDDVTGTPYTQWLLDGTSVAGMIEMDDKWPTEVPSHWMVYFNVSSADESVARAVKLGATVTVPAFPAGPGVIAVLKDPQGAMFSVVEIQQPM